MKAPALGCTDSMGFEAGMAGNVCGSFLLMGFAGNGGGFGRLADGAGGSLGTKPFYSFPLSYFLSGFLEGIGLGGAAGALLLTAGGSEAT